MAGTDSSAKGRRSIRFVCMTPESHCNGSKCGKQAGKTHSNQAQAHECSRKYLIGQGYTQLTPRMFASPNDGPVICLNKKAPRAKPGKSQTVFMSQPLKIRPSLPPPRP